MDVIAQARLLQPYMVQARRRLHREPELGFEEQKTSAYVAEELRHLGYAVTRLSPTGILGELEGMAPGKTVLLRADMDALPIREETGLPFASAREGVSHACGHDFHTAMLLGAAKLLSQERGSMRGSVRLLFQPGEETGRGASEMIKQGVLESVDACFAEHVAPRVPTGAIATGEGQLMAGAGTFRIKIRGEACHGAMPHMGADALLAGAQTVVSLQSIVSREVAPLKPLVVTAGTFHAGSRYNVVSGEAEIEGTVRALDGELLRETGSRIARVASGVAAAHRCAAQCEYAITCESLTADPVLAELVRSAARELLEDPALLLTLPPDMGSEDFSDIAALKPSAFAIVGVGGEHPLHSGFFEGDEAAMPIGAALYARFALDFLTQ